MSTRRFVDYARHGGCSMKLSPQRLGGLLGSVRGFDGEGSTWPDAGVGAINGQRLASSVDVVLPMVDDPATFGRIVVNHVLSDLYAVGATPQLALSILGIPEPGDGEDEEPFNAHLDAEVRRMLGAADEELAAIGVKGLGGHTLMDHALFFGMAAVGSVPDGGGVSNSTAVVGDALVLTKPIGTSVATKLWKLKEKARSDFGEVTDSMLRSNRLASEAMLRLGRCSCTDVTGFGLCGHLHNMMRASDAAATIDVAAVPVFESVRSHSYLEEDTTTRLFAENRGFLSSYLVDELEMDDPELALFLDAQVSGGLLIAMPPEAVDGFRVELADRGETAWRIGEVVAGRPGAITLR